MICHRADICQDRTGATSQRYVLLFYYSKYFHRGRDVVFNTFTHKSQLCTHLQTTVPVTKQCTMATSLNSHHVCIPLFYQSSPGDTPRG